MNDRSPFPTIVLAAFLAGLLDLVLAIIVYSVFLDKTTAVKILQSVASGAFGKAAYEGGIKMAALGIVFHFAISLMFTLFYFFIYPRLAFLRQHGVISGMVYGIFIWMVMNLIVLPIAFSGMLPMEPGATMIGISIIILGVGLPISLIAHFYFTRSTQY